MSVIACSVPATLMQHNRDHRMSVPIQRVCHHVFPWIRAWTYLNPAPAQDQCSRKFDQHKE